MRAKDNEGNLSEFSETVLVTIPSSPGPDTTPPTIPAGLDVPGVEFTGITLGWEPSRDNVGVEKYAVYVDEVLYSEVFLPNTYLVIDNLDCGTTYDITVTAIDSSENESAPSNIFKATTALCIAENPLQEAIYRIKNKNSGRYLELDPVDSTVVSAQSNGNELRRQWKIEWLSLYTYRVKNRANGLYLTGDSNQHSIVKTGSFVSNTQELQFDMKRSTGNEFNIICYADDL